MIWTLHATGALPLFALRLIQDLGIVIVMDGEDDRRRKEMFLSLVGSEAIGRLAELTAVTGEAECLNGSVEGALLCCMKRVTE